MIKWSLIVEYRKHEVRIDSHIQIYALSKYGLYGSSNSANFWSSKQVLHHFTDFGWILILILEYLPIFQNSFFTPPFSN